MPEADSARLGRDAQRPDRSPSRPSGEGTPTVRHGHVAETTVSLHCWGEKVRSRAWRRPSSRPEPEPDGGSARALADLEAKAFALQKAQAPCPLAGHEGSMPEMSRVIPWSLEARGPTRDSSH